MAASVMRHLGPDVKSCEDEPHNVHWGTSSTLITDSDSDSDSRYNNAYLLRAPISYSDGEDHTNDNTSQTGCTHAMQSVADMFHRMYHSCVQSETANENTKMDVRQLSPCPLPVGASATPTPKVHKLQNSDTKINNIYRRPASRTSNRPRSSSFSPRSVRFSDTRPRASSYSWCQTQSALRTSGQSGSMRRTVTTDEDVVGTHTSWIHHSSNCIQQLRARNPRLRTNTFDTFSKESATNFLMVELRPRPRASSMPEYPHSMLKQQDTAQKSTYRNNKHACFKNRTQVHLFKDKDKAIYSAGSGRKCEHKNINNDLQALVNNRQPSGRYLPQNDSVCKIEGNVVQMIDTKGAVRQHLLLTIETKGNFIREKTSVKSLSSGTALIVDLVPEASGRNNSGPVMPIEKRLPLPLTIDPYHMKASVQPNGILVIRAPIVNLST